MKKNIFMVSLFATAFIFIASFALVTQADNVDESAETVSVPNTDEPEEIAVFPLEGITPENFLEQEENIPYYGECNNYSFESYQIDRFDDFIALRNEDSDYTLFLSGEHFILEKSDSFSIWYVNEEREISRLNVEEYLKNKNTGNELISDIREYEKSSEYHTYGNADIPINFIESISDLPFNELSAENLEFINHDEIQILKNTETTALIKGNTMYVFRFKACESTYEFPFKFKEIYRARDDVYNFVTSTNAVGAVHIWPVGNPSYRLVLGESESGRHLFVPNEENHVTRFESSPDWIIFYDEGNLKAGKVCEPEMTFSFDNLPYEYRWIGDSCGVGKGTSEVSFLAETDYYDDSEITEELINQLVEETGINY